jgi:hypothetical protein
MRWRMMGSTQELRLRESGRTVNEDAVHILVGQRDWIITRVTPQLNARYSTLEAATEHAREIAVHGQSVLLVHDALGEIATRESYRYA